MGPNPQQPTSPRAPGPPRVQPPGPTSSLVAALERLTRTLTTTTGGAGVGGGFGGVSATGKLTVLLERLVTLLTRVMERVRGALDPTGGPLVTPDAPPVAPPAAGPPQPGAANPTGTPPAAPPTPPVPPPTPQQNPQSAPQSAPQPPDVQTVAAAVVVVLSALASRAAQAAGRGGPPALPPPVTLALPPAGGTVPATQPAPAGNRGPQMPVSAFDRPTPVIVVGPKPLPVTYVGAPPAQNPPPVAHRAPRGFGDALADMAPTLDGIAAAAAAAQRGLAAFITGMEGVLESLGQQFTKFVSLSSPSTVIRFNLALRDTQAVIGQILTPVVERFTQIIRKLGDALASLSDPTKSMLGGLAAGSGLAGVFTALAAAASVLVRTLGGIPVAIATVVGAVLGVATTMGKWEDVSASLNEILKIAGTGIETVARIALPPLLDVVGALASVLVETHKAAAPLAEALGLGLAAAFRVAGVLLMPLVQTLGMLTRVLTPVLKLFAALSEVVASAIEGVAASLGSILGGLVELLSGPLTSALQQFAAWVDMLVVRVKNFVDEVREFFGLPALEDYDPSRKSSVGAAVRGANIGSLSTLVNQAYTSALQSGMQSIPQKQLDKLGGIHETLKGLPRKFADELGNFAKKQLNPLDRDGAVGKVVHNIPVAGIPGVPAAQVTIGDIRKWWERR